MTPWFLKAVIAMPDLYPILLCGGSGTRLWPMSRKSFPKQFVRFTDGPTLFQAAALRATGRDVRPPIVMTGADFRFIVAEQLAQIGIDPGPILIEPAPRNTAPAVLAAALHVARNDPKALMLVMPSDHDIPDHGAFAHAVEQGRTAAATGQIVTFGIRPDRAETGYGWLELTEAPQPDACHPIPLRQFIEKPEIAQAEAMWADPRYLWNAGIFLMSAETAIAAFTAHASDLIDPVRSAVDAARVDLGFVRLDPDAWNRAQDISVDYAVMEKADNLTVVPFSGAWSDLGDWASIWRAGPGDATGNVINGPVTALDCANTLLRAEVPGQELVTIGVQDLTVIAMPDAVLVAGRGGAQQVRQAVKLLQSKGAPQAEAFRHAHRPWGWFETLVSGERFQVKRIHVHPGAALSLQSHLHRAEHWVVVAGTARVTVEDRVQIITENQSLYVPLGARHRLENPGKVPAVLIEVQTGAYLGEDDIIRHEDLYARDQGGWG